jgi:hypothetical protein
MEVSEDNRADLEGSGRYQSRHGSFRKITVPTWKFQENTSADMEVSG